MPRGRRYIESGAVYELCFRARDSLPLVAHNYMNFILQCVLARVQRDDKVTLCHHIWNGSHPHLIVVSRDSQQLVRFYSEIQKKVTDIIKRLLSLEHLEIWEGNTSVIKIGDLEAAKDRISYLYANPAKDNLVDSIENFPGLSSWSNFQKTIDKLDAETSSQYPRLGLRTIPSLSTPDPSPAEGERVIRILANRNKSLLHALKISPNAWMRCFGVRTDNEVRIINHQILNQIKFREKSAREKRTSEGKPLMGAAKLSRQPLLKSHRPKKKNPKIVIITTVKEIRFEYIDRVERFRQQCRHCYERWKAGEISISWPAEAFKPPLPPTLNLFAV